MIARTNAMQSFVAASDQRGKEGFFVDAAGVIMAVINAAPYGVILEGGNTGETTTVALCAGGFAGTVKVKLSASPGSVVRGSNLELDAAGTTKIATATATRVLVAQAVEAGVANELIEAVLFRPAINP
jgi:hypothetical protein